MPDFESRLLRAYRAGVKAPKQCVYVSANTRTGTQLHDIPGLIDSDAHRSLRADTPHGSDAVGVWADGAEPSRIVPWADEVDGAKLGLKYKQKVVLHWFPHDDGPHTRHLIATSHQDVPVIKEVLAKHGVPYLSTELRTNGAITHVIDDSNTHAAGVAAAAKELGGVHREERGTSKALGDWDDAEKSAAIFQQIIGEHRAHLDPGRPQ